MSSFFLVSNSASSHCPPPPHPHPTHLPSASRSVVVFDHAALGGGPSTFSYASSLTNDFIRRLPPSRWPFPGHRGAILHHCEVSRWGRASSICVYVFWEASVNLYKQHRAANSFPPVLVATSCSHPFQIAFSSPFERRWRRVLPLQAPHIRNALGHFEMPNKWLHLLSTSS